MDIDKENTFRALKDEKPIAKRQWMCNFFNIHTWTRYEKPVVRSNGMWDVSIQFRECACCGIVGKKILGRE
jgi:hypothetical protein